MIPGLAALASSDRGSEPLGIIHNPQTFTEALSNKHLQKMILEICDLSACL